MIVVLCRFGVKRCCSFVGLVVVFEVVVCFL